MSTPIVPSPSSAPEPAGPHVLSVPAFLQWAGISRFLFYQEVERGHIRPKRCGSRTMVPQKEAERWLRSLPDLDTASHPGRT